MSEVPLYDEMFSDEFDLHLLSGGLGSIQWPSSLVLYNSQA